MRLKQFYHIRSSPTQNTNSGRAHFYTQLSSGYKKGRDQVERSKAAEYKGEIQQSQVRKYKQNLQRSLVPVTRVYRGII